MITPPLTSNGQIVAVARRARALFADEQAEDAYALLTQALQDHDDMRLKRVLARVHLFLGDEDKATQLLREIVPNAWQLGFWELAQAGAEYGYCTPSDTHKLLYFPVRKCGCTSLYNMMRTLESEAPLGEGVHDALEHRLVQLSTLRQNFPDYRTFIVVRDPIARVRSFYYGNVWARDHLLVDTGGKTSFYGLPTKPDYATFIQNFDAYRRTFITVRNHTEPLVSFAGQDASLFDDIYALKDVDKLIKKLSDDLGVSLSFNQEMKSPESVPSDEILTEEQALKDMYRADYAIYGKWF